MTIRFLLTLAVAGAALLATGAARAQITPPTYGPVTVEQASAAIAKATAPAKSWPLPPDGPKAAAGKLVIYISADQRNGGALGVGNGAAEAAKAIGWEFKLIDGQGSVPQQTAAINQAIALKPNGIILGTIDAVGQKTAVDHAIELGIKVVGWHAGPKPGPLDDPKVFANITTFPQDIAETAADFAIARSQGHAQVAIERNSETLIGRLKGETIKARIEACAGCKVLSYDIIPISETSTRMPSLTASLKQRFPTELTWMLAINDLYFDFAVPALRSAGVGPEGPPVLISAGDGSVSAYGRIRSGQYQVATVPEPLNLQGWETIDELNRAFAGVPTSGYRTPVHLVTKDNVELDGGRDNHFDPDNGYRERYKQIWGVK